MKDKYVIVSKDGEIITIVMDKETADHFAKFLIGAEAAPISNWDFNYGPIRSFIGS